MVRVFPLLAHQGAALLPGQAEGPEEGKAACSSHAVVLSCSAGCPLVLVALVTDTAVAAVASAVTHRQVTATATCEGN